MMQQRFWPRMALMALLAGWTSNNTLAQTTPDNASIPLESLALTPAQVQLLEEYFPEGARNDVSGRFVYTARNTVAFEPDNTALPRIEISQPWVVSPLAIGASVSVQASYDSRSNKIVVHQYELDSIKTLFDTIDDLKPRVSNISRGAVSTASELAQQLQRATRDTAMSVGGIDALDELAQRSLDDIVKKYRQAREADDPEEMDIIITAYRISRDTAANTLPQGSRLKAIFGDYDNYPTWHYARITEIARASVGIWRENARKPSCSGVLVGDDLVLTAAHCFGDDKCANHEDPVSYRVGLGYVSRPDASEPPPVLLPVKDVAYPLDAGRWSRIRECDFSRSTLDFVLLRLDVAALGTAAHEALDAARPRPLCRKTPRGNDPVFAISHARGERQIIHDNGRVRLPFRVGAGSDYATLEVELQSDFDDPEWRIKVREEIAASYIEDPSLLPSASSPPARFLHDIRAGGRPMMGVSLDTFGGSSGGPVFDRERDMCVAGIVVGGMPDTGERRKATWNAHEHILPSMAIIKALRDDPASRALVDGSAGGVALQ